MPHYRKSRSFLRRKCADARLPRLRRFAALPAVGLMLKVGSDANAMVDRLRPPR